MQLLKTEPGSLGIGPRFAAGHYTGLDEITGVLPHDIAKAQARRYVVRSVLERFKSHGRARKRMLLSLIQDAELVAKANTLHVAIMRLLMDRLVEIDSVRYRRPTDLLCVTASGALLGSIRSMLFTESAYTPA